MVLGRRGYVSDLVTFGLVSDFRFLNPKISFFVYMYKSGISGFETRIFGLGFIANYQA